MTNEQFQQEIRAGIPETLPPMPVYDNDINHAPRRKDILTADEKRLRSEMRCVTSPNIFMSS